MDFRKSRARENNGVNHYASSRLGGIQARHRARAAWDTVWRLLNGPRRRRDSRGRDVYEVWADQVLENPAEMIAFAMREIMPEEASAAAANPLIANIQSLYLTAVQAANREPIEPPASQAVELQAIERNEW